MFTIAWTIHTHDSTSNTSVTHHAAIKERQYRGVALKQLLGWEGIRGLQFEALILQNMIPFSRRSGRAEWHADPAIRYLTFRVRLLRRDAGAD